MILLISPAKTLDQNAKRHSISTQIRFVDKSWELVSRLKKQSQPSIKKLMGISDKLTQLNHYRYQQFSEVYNEENSDQALFYFKGDVYLGLDAQSFSKRDINFAQKHLRILSGLYGLLRPLDLIQAYRLEMGTKLKIRRNKNLYEFWGDHITNLVNNDLQLSKSKYLINLASNEYYKAIKKDKIDATIIDIDFREYRGEQLKFISFSAKKARGLMCQYIIKNKIKKTEDIKAFDYENYRYAEDLSNSNKWCFVR